jgi:hypothetical protein
MAAEAVLIVDEGRGWHYSVDSVLADHWLGTPGSDDALGMLLAGGGAAPLGPIQADRIARRLGAFTAQLDAALRSRDLGRLGGADFLRFLLNALRALIFAREFGRRRLWLRAAPEEIVGYLKAETPLRGRFPDLLLEAQREVAAGGPFNERLRAKSLRLLEACARSVEGGERRWDALDALNGEPDERRLSASVVIVTRDRPAQFARCVASLVGQRRLPDELVVVDGSASAETTAVVSRAAAPFPTRLVRGSGPGVAAARNAGLAAAAGEMIAFIDDDAVAEAEWLEALEFCLLRDPRVGIAGGSVLHLEDGRDDVVARFMRVVQKL